MKRENIRPLPTHFSKKKVTKIRQKIWVVLILVLLLIAIGYLILGRSGTESTLPVQGTTSVPMTEPLQTELTTENTSEEPDNTALNDSMLTDETSIEANDESSTIPNPAAILEAPLPETDSLAKEEIDRLEDERKRLAEQEKLTTEQLTMNKQLTDMKAEQIDLLEQQIAQLEAASSTKTQAQ
ncbi:MULTISPECIES: hypothetical protein [unclassified Psychrobacter]|uniref:hypothetical protein n=1 Tax=unclassified Psychrobacter TaxID=196806 RepID=UPI0025B2C3C9|nr:MULTISPECIES: hypothetical protein [unclassified Psychrobacter]MDN3452374.1 hypothetical protein [Psychrobacter sp. APC 3350]MDN3501702.1 hypothetical protein [Psychrobacter sp. 5A.1]